MSKVKSQTKKEITLMLIPNQGKVFSYKISPLVVKILSVFLLVIIGSCAFILTRAIDYELIRRANVRLTEKNVYFSQELAKNHEAFQRVVKMEDELKAMLELKNKKELLKFKGAGGPTLADQMNLMQTLSNRSNLTTKEFTQSISYLRKNANFSLENYRELKRYIANQCSLMASKPTNWPVRGWVTSYFGRRKSPFFEKTTFHHGIDIANEEGMSIKASADGIVTYSNWEGSYGKLIVVDHGYGFSTRYGHLQRFIVNVGQRVKTGQVIGFMGNTGRSTAPHLHFEVRVNGVPVDPLKYLKKKN